MSIAILSLILSILCPYHIYQRKKSIMTPYESLAKRRKPGVSAFLSLISLGLGQIYNGELLKGVLLKIILLLSLCLYALLVFKSSSELLFLSLFLGFFVFLKAYSMVQAFVKSRTLGTSYILKTYNRFFFYAVFAIVLIALNVILPLTIAKYALMDMTPYHPFRSMPAKERYLKMYDKWAREWPVESETRMVDTSYGQTFIRISGPDAASPLVLLPGASATSLMWLPNIEALSKLYRTYAVDNIYDLGRSVFTRTMKTPDDFVNWLDELFNALELGEQINIMGMSYGGWLTSQYALHFPNRLDRIVLLAPASTVLPLNFEFLKHALIALVPHRRFTKIMMDWLLTDWENSENAKRRLLEDWMESIYLGSRCFKPKMLVSPTVLTDQELQSLKVPALYLVGENEKIYSAHAALERLERVAPQIETKLIPDAGHDLTVVQAEMVNEIVQEFLKRPVE
jgi:pimeloyl-ACP methyl ester carboxylesterase/TM2 domain-containing membrane protein YozV